MNMEIKTRAMYPLAKKCHRSPAKGEARGEYGRKRLWTCSAPRHWNDHRSKEIKLSV